jgi:hypothetical protein
MQKKVINVEFSLIEDIDKDLSSVTESLRSARKALLQVESLIVKNANALKTATSAISRVESVAKEIGADSVMKEAQKRATLVKQLSNTVNKTLSDIGNVISNL